MWLGWDEMGGICQSQMVALRGWDEKAISPTARPHHSPRTHTHAHPPMLIPIISMSLTGAATAAG